MASRLPKAGLVTVVGHGTPCCTPFATRPDVSRSGAPPDRQLSDRACDCGELVVPNAIAWNVDLEDDPVWSVEFAHVAADIFILNTFNVIYEGVFIWNEVLFKYHIHYRIVKGSQ